MPRSSSATRRRLLDAAYREFSRYGLAGGRVDRIAIEARANKRLIYVYFGDKHRLFDLVADQRLQALHAGLPFDAGDLPATAGALFDRLVADPDLARLVAWKQLERPDATMSELDVYLPRLSAVADAQHRGILDASIRPVDLLALTFGLATAWLTASATLRTLSGDDPFGDARLAEHRSGLLKSVRRAVGASGGR